MDLKSIKINKIAKYQDIIALLCLVGAVLFFIWKATYGFGLSDESQNLAYAFRLIMGDSLVTDEWYMSQLQGFLLYLPVKAYLSIAGSTDGILLFSRYLFILLQSTVSMVIYYRLRNHGYFSILAALIFFFHIPFFIYMGIGYYSMGHAFVALTGVLMATTQVFSKTKFYLTGLFLACAVLCNPVLVFVYLLYSVCMVICEASKNKKHPCFSFSLITFKFKTWLWITLGTATIAAIFFVFLFSRTSLSEIIRNFPMLFTDPEYQFSSTGSGVQNIFSIQKTISEIFKINPFLFSAFSILIAVIIFDRKRRDRRSVYLSAGSVIFFACIIYMTLSFKFPYYGYWMLPLTLLGLICYILSENKDRNMFAFVWLFGLLYAACMDIASNMGFIVASQALIVSDVASVIFIKNVIDEQRKQYKAKTFKKPYNKKPSNKNQTELRIITCLLTAALLLQIFQECYIAADLKFNYEYLVLDAKAKIGVSIQRDSSEKLNVVIENGPAKGLKTTSYKAKIYNGILSDLSYIKDKGNGPVLITATFPWGYLYLDLPYATFTARIQSSKISTEKQRLLKYYELHPQKTPKFIYVPKYDDVLYTYTPETAKNILAVITENLIFTVKESPYGYIVETAN